MTYQVLSSTERGAHFTRALAKTEFGLRSMQRIPWFAVVLLATWGCITGSFELSRGGNFVVGFLGGIAWPLGITTGVLAFIFVGAGLAKFLGRRYGRGADWTNAGVTIGFLLFILFAYPLALLALRALRFVSSRV